jgi:hypothetical protein
MSTRESRGKSDWEDQDLLDNAEAAIRIRRALEEEGAVVAQSGPQAARVAALKARLRQLEELIDESTGDEPNPLAE